MLRPLEQSNNLKNPSKLNMALVNIQSLKPKLDMLIHHMQVINIDMVFVTETWTEDGNDSEHQYIKASLVILLDITVLIQSSLKTGRQAFIATTVDFIRSEGNLETHIQLTTWSFE